KRITTRPKSIASLLTMQVTLISEQYRKFSYSSKFLEGLLTNLCSVLGWTNAVLKRLNAVDELRIHGQPPNWLSRPKWLLFRCGDRGDCYVWQRTAAFLLGNVRTKELWTLLLEHSD